ncbi:hypothetical protein C2S51_001133 [Perilla frutescens var. frutescens]|nr:hypothetical protein C2S51_001133 [Perilla frutescens var. frutescens]
MSLSALHYSNCNAGASSPADSLLQTMSTINSGRRWQQQCRLAALLLIADPCSVDEANQQ